MLEKEKLASYSLGQVMKTWDRIKQDSLWKVFDGFESP
jgi:hypothetical protein